MKYLSILNNIVKGTFPLICYHKVQENVIAVLGSVTPSWSTLAADPDSHRAIDSSLAFEGEISPVASQGTLVHHVGKYRHWFIFFRSTKIMSCGGST